MFDQGRRQTQKHHGAPLSPPSFWRRKDEEEGEEEERKEEISPPLRISGLATGDTTKVNSSTDGEL